MIIFAGTLGGPNDTDHDTPKYPSDTKGKYPQEI